MICLSVRVENSFVCVVFVVFFLVIILIRTVRMVGIDLMVGFIFIIIKGDVGRSFMDI